METQSHSGNTRQDYSAHEWDRSAPEDDGQNRARGNPYDAILYSVE